MNLAKAPASILSWEAFARLSQMPNQEYYIERIESELAIAHEAVKTGNDGKARVCARRAAGQAISWFLTKHRRENWGPDAMSQLRALMNDHMFPDAVLAAATRLTTKISDRFRYPFSEDPIEDACLIIDHIRRLMEPHAE